VGGWVRACRLLLELSGKRMRQVSGKRVREVLLQRCAERGVEVRESLVTRVTRPTHDRNAGEKVTWQEHRRESNGAGTQTRE
jgi:hypothetical protein